MFKRILVPLDGSQLAEEVLSRFARVLRHPHAEVHVVSALGFRPPEDTCTKSLARELTEDAERYLAKIERRLVDEGLRVRTKIIEDAAAEGILDYAASSRSSMIVMSTHGRTGMARWLIGSVAEKVMRSAAVPVLLARSLAARGTAPSPNILLPVEGLFTAIPPASMLAAYLDARVTLYHKSPKAGGDADAEEMLREAKRAMSDVPVATRLDYTDPDEKFDPAAAILDWCGEGRFDMIAMATHGRSGLRRWALGSCTEKVLRHAEVPMLVVCSGA